MSEKPQTVGIRVRGVRGLTLDNVSSYGSDVGIDVEDAADVKMTNIKTISKEIAEVAGKSPPPEILEAFLKQLEADVEKANEQSGLKKWLTDNGVGIANLAIQVGKVFGG